MSLKCVIIYVLVRVLQRSRTNSVYVCPDIYIFICITYLYNTNESETERESKELAHIIIKCPKICSWQARDPGELMV